VAAALGAVVALSLFVLLQMGQDVRREIDALATANSDSTQWSLAQADVELLALKWAIAAAEADAGTSVADVRTRFDVLYSRVRTVSSSPLYAALRDEPDVIAALERINAYLTESFPVIDADDETLAAALPDLAARTETIRADVRQVTLAGVAVLARAADAQRGGIAETLALVSALTATLFFVLIVLLALLIHFVRREQERAREHGLVRSRLASIVGTSLDAVLVVARDGRVIEFNGAAEEIFGYSRDEAIGAMMEDLIIPEHLLQAHQAGMNRYLTTGEKHVIGKGRVQLEACRKNGEIFPVELSISTADSEYGELFVSFARDISRRVAAERELIAARDEAVAGERAKADLIAVMSHEMRTPLNGMLGTLELLDGEGRNPKDAEYLDIIRASGRQLLHHVDNVLEISRAEAGKIVPARDTFSVPALVRELVESQRGVAEHRGNALSHRVDTHGKDYAIGDPIHIRQVLLNLIGNAIKFTRNGSITVEAERLPDSDLVEFRVVDTGIGIDPVDQERVFDDFVTLDTSYSRAVGGTGLGLAIVKRLTGAMGGEVGLDSVNGGGSVFWVRLPLPAAAEDATATGPVDRRAVPSLKATAPLKILIVEDNRINRIVLRDLLERDGHKVDEAHDGQQGVDRVRQTSYDLVFMDISMPVMDGVEATRAVRQSEPRGTRLPMIALTAHARTADKERFRAAGLDDILVKPISRDALRAVIVRHAGSGLQATGSSDASGPDGRLLDHAHLDGLSEAIGPDRIAALIVEFASEMEDAIATIAGSVEQGRTDAALGAKVHHAAGSTALFGAEALREALASLEQRIERGEACDRGLGDVLRRTWADTRAELHARTA
jgi:PAS domain S-box-containing protein